MTLAEESGTRENISQKDLRENFSTRHRVSLRIPFVMKILACLFAWGLIFVLAACTAPEGGYPDVHQEIDVQAERPPGSDGTNRANGPVGS